jgi:hypothetical protein
LNGLHRKVSKAIMTVPRPTDEQLDTFIRARLALVGIDLDDLPVDDPAAPADQVRLMSSLRTFLRNVPAAISDFSMDPQLRIPSFYPPEFMSWTSPGSQAPR